MWEFLFSATKKCQNIWQFFIKQAIIYFIVKYCMYCIKMTPFSFREHMLIYNTDSHTFVMERGSLVSSNLKILIVSRHARMLFCIFAWKAWVNFDVNMSWYCCKVTLYLPHYYPLAIETNDQISCWWQYIQLQRTVL